jgi:putative DNA primase/helicase
MNNYTSFSVDASAKPNPKTWADMDELIGPIEWALKPWLPKGFLTILAGQSGAGKSALVLRLAGCFTNGLPWPDGSPFNDEPGCVLWCEAEASQGLNLERAKKWGIDINKIYTPLDDPLQDINLDDEKHKEAIRKRASLSEVRFIVTDSLRGSNRQDENSSNVVSVVQFLATLARDTNKSVILTHHLRKKSLMDGDTIDLDRLRGSSAIVSTAGVVWALDNPNTGQDKRLRVIKSNIGKYPEAIGVRIDEEGIHFCDAPQSVSALSEKERAAQFLISKLENGPIEASEIIQESELQGINKRTLYIAKAELGIKSKKENARFGRWYWYFEQQNLQSLHSLQSLQYLQPSLS